ncbi:acetamidase/formamidase family protein [Candidatus Bipolaricaulota bacterium]
MKQTLVVDTFTGGRMGPDEPMVGPITVGDSIRAVTAPGCCGPLITTHFRGAHEVTTPVEVLGAEAGDAIALRIGHIKIRSAATSSGVSFKHAERWTDEGLRRCPICETTSPKSVVEGIGPSSIRCAECGAEISPVGFHEGYTAVFDDHHTVGLSVPKASAEEIARSARVAAGLPPNAEQNSILLFGMASMVGTLIRVRPFIGHVGTCPSAEIPDSSNAGDSAMHLVGATHAFGFRDEPDMREHVTDAHIDSDAVTTGAILICPVKRKGGGIYFGDVHAIQGEGELAGHTLDVSADVEIGILGVLPGLGLDGPILLPPEEFLAPAMRPYTAEELAAGQEIAQQHNVELEAMGPIEFIGTGATTDAASENALDRAERLLGLSRAELRNRCTVTGGVRIGRLGTVRLGLLAPLRILDKLNLGRSCESSTGYLGAKIRRCLESDHAKRDSNPPSHQLVGYCGPKTGMIFLRLTPKRHVMSSCQILLDFLVNSGENLRSSGKFADAGRRSLPLALLWLTSRPL